MHEKLNNKSSGGHNYCGRRHDKEKKIRSTLACTSSFLTFLHHYSQRKAAVRSTAQIKKKQIQTTKLCYNAWLVFVFRRYLLFCKQSNKKLYKLAQLRNHKKKYGAHSHVHLLSWLSSHYSQQRSAVRSTANKNP